jgi:hypothetical protein
VERLFGEDDRRRVFILSNTNDIMSLFILVYEGFTEKLDECLGTFSDSEIQVIETYLIQAIEIMDETTKSISKN